MSCKGKARVVLNMMSNASGVSTYTYKQSPDTYRRRLGVAGEIRKNFVNVSGAGDAPDRFLPDGNVLRIYQRTKEPYLTLSSQEFQKYSTQKVAIDGLHIPSMFVEAERNGRSMTEVTVTVERMQLDSETNDNPSMKIYGEPEQMPATLTKTDDSFILEYGENRYELSHSEMLQVVATHYERDVFENEKSF